MYKFVNGNDLNEAHLSQVAELVLQTGYFDLASQNNKLGLDLIEFQVEVTVIPALDFLRVILDEGNDVAGFYLALTKAETLEMLDRTPYGYAETPDNLIFSNEIYNLYIEKTTETDLIVHYRAIRENLQGQGLFKLLMRDLILMAKNKGCQVLYSATWETKIKSLAIFKYYGATVRGLLDFSHTYYQDKLINLVTAVSAVESRLATPR